MHSISIYPCPLVGLGSSLCEFDSKDQVSVAIYVTVAVSFEKEYVVSCVCGKLYIWNGMKWMTLTTVNLLTRLRSIAPLLETDKRKPLRPLRIPVLCQKHARNPTEAFENLP